MDWRLYVNNRLFSAGVVSNAQSPTRFRYSKIFFGAEINKEDDAFIGQMGYLWYAQPDNSFILGKHAYVFDTHSNLVCIHKGSWKIYRGDEPFPVLREELDSFSSAGEDLIRVYPSMGNSLEGCVNSLTEDYVNFKISGHFNDAFNRL